MDYTRNNLISAATSFSPTMTTSFLQERPSCNNVIPAKPEKPAGMYISILGATTGPTGTLDIVARFPDACR